MLMDLVELKKKYMTKPLRGVIHCGARYGEEVSDYLMCSIRNVWWIEGNPEVIPQLRTNVSSFGNHVIEAVLSDVDGKPVTLHITNYAGISSSILSFGTHQDSYPDIEFVSDHTAKARTLDSLVAEYQIKDCNFLTMDLQGGEGHCLRGATSTLPSIDYVMSEINTEEVYEGCVLLPDLDELLSDFERVETYMAGPGWGDALWCRRRPSR